MTLGARQRQLLQALWRAGRLSRRELHQRTRIRPNTLGGDVSALLRAGILRETGTKSQGRGRPRVPLEIDPSRRHVVGVAIRPGHVEAGRLNLRGEAIDSPADRPASDPHQIIEVTTELLREQIDDRTFAVGISTPGFVDPGQHTILFSSATLGSGAVSLEPAYAVAGKLPVILENDMHALAARWLLTHQAEQKEDVLLIYFEDGQLGAALLVEGKPNRGCVTGANELGHTRLPVETERCYCGHAGCLERICDTKFLKRQDGRDESLARRVANLDGQDDAVRRMIDLLSEGFANAVNFTRVNRLVLVGELTRHRAFAEALERGVHGRLLPELAGRVRIDWWDQPAARSAETAGWLALASLYYEGWHRLTRREPTPAAAT